MELDSILHIIGVWLYEDVDTMAFINDEEFEAELKEYEEMGYVVERKEMNSIVKVFDGERVIAGGLLLL